MKVFIDTSAFMTLIFKDESLHQKVVDQYKLYSTGRVQLITSDYILDELYTRCLYIAKRYKKRRDVIASDYRAGSHGAKLAIKLIKEVVVSGELTVLEVESHIFQKAESVFLKFSDHKISFTDATTYILYKDFSLDEIFTLDDDFKKMGLRISR